jgi:hypothetical protein
MTAPFVVATLHTPDYRGKAERLAASCRAFGLTFAAYEVPQIHSSISRHGADDPALAKPATIRRALSEHAVPVLYLDADMVIVQPLDGLAAIARACDFAIYNWLADPASDAWRPVDRDPATTRVREARYWELRHAIDYHDEAQLICSGATQLWAPSPAALALLDDWQAAIAAFPGAADDECLDFAFNNRDNGALRPGWLDKSFVRYPWWPHVRPVIDHPDPTGTRTPASIPEDGPRRRFYPERAGVKLPPPDSLPRSAILDIEEGWLLREANGQLVRVERARTAFWP